MAMAFDFDPEKIRRLRTERAWTQEKLAEVAGLSVRTVQRLEKGICGSFATLQAVAQAMGVGVETLRAGDATRRPEPDEEKVGTLLVRLQSGTEVLRVVAGVHVFEFGHDDLRDESEVELVGEFLQLLQDYSDIWGELPAAQKVRAGFELQGYLNWLAKAGFWVFGGQVVKRFKVGDVEGGSVAWRVAVIRVLRSNNPAIVVYPRSKANAYQLV